MDLKKYDKLKKKIDTKDFEGSNEGLDKWLFRFSFIGNMSSIFFAYFLVYPSLLKAITSNFINGIWGTSIAFLITLIFLSIFEITKRYVIRNFSNDFVVNKRKLSFKIFGWSTISIAIITISFYLSITGSKNLATTSILKNIVAKTVVVSEIDSLNAVYDKKKLIYLMDNESLRAVNTDLRGKLAGTPINYRTVRNEYQVSIDKNGELIIKNDDNINELNDELKVKMSEVNQSFKSAKFGNETEDSKNILLFIIIVVFNELIIMGGLYFREFYEYNLYLINQDKFNKIHQKKDRYRSLLTFIYANGKLVIGDRVMSGVDLKTVVTEKTLIPNPNKFVGDFLRDMDVLGIFTTIGKRRNINIAFNDALDIIENYDDTYRILENIK